MTDKKQMVKDWTAYTEGDTMYFRHKDCVPMFKESEMTDEEKELMAKVTENVEAQRDHKEFDEKGLGYYILKIKNEDKNNTL